MNKTHIDHFHNNNWRQLFSDLISTPGLASDPLYHPFLGISAHNLGRHQLAINTLSQVKDDSELFVQSCIYRGLSCMAIREFSLAIQSFNAALVVLNNLDLRSASIFINLSNCYAFTGNTVKAIEAVRCAILISPKCGLNYFVISRFFNDVSKVNRSLHLAIDDRQLPSNEFRDAIQRLYSQGEMSLAITSYIQHINNMELSIVL